MEQGTFGRAAPRWPRLKRSYQYASPDAHSAGAVACGEAEEGERTQRK